jgi:D-xylose transport system ATP-binding protein
MALVSEDRKRLGLIPSLGVAFNMSLSAIGTIRRGPLVDHERELARVRDLGGTLRLSARDAGQPVTTLSGGNQQKVVIGKALMTRPSILLLDEPTRGIDIGARQEVYQLMNELADAGTAIVMVSSELNELLGMSDRVLMLHEGRVGGIFNRADATEERLLAAAMGLGTHAA